MAASAISSVESAVRGAAAPPVVSRANGRTVVWLDGENDIATVLELGDTLARAIALDDSDMIIDLSGVTFISAATIGVLIRGQNFLRRESRTMTLRSPSTCAVRVIDVCGLGDLVGRG